MLSLQSKREKREAAIRSSLLDRLKDCVQSLIYGPGGENIPRLSSNTPRTQVLGHNDNTNALCSIVEAIFIHGLKDSLSDRLSSMFLAEVGRMPVPNFWHAVMVISHRDLIEQVTSLQFIMTDVGKARAWMRLVLNQGQLISYLSVLASDSHTLKDYYRPSAFLRDIECCDIMLRIMQPLSGISFNLATNSSILNTWSQTPLILSGVWTPTKFERNMEPVLSATDVASTFSDMSADPIEIDQSGQTSVSDQMFDLIMGSTPETHFIQETLDKNKFQTNYKDEDLCKETKADNSGACDSISNDKVEEAVSPLGEGNGNREETLTSNIEESTIHQSVSSVATASDVDSVMNRSTSIMSETNEYRNLLFDWDSQEPHQNLPAFLNFSSSTFQSQVALSDCSKQLPEQEGDFEILSTDGFSEEDMNPFLSILTKICPEKGLDHQNFQCGNIQCSAPVGLIYGKPKVCKYDGRYYCDNCHQGDTSLIPSRIIFNWDFGLYPVSVSHKEKLDAIYVHPLFNLRVLCPALYQHFYCLSEVQVLRLQLHFIQAYLFTCSNSNSGQKLRQIFWPREHLFEHVHLYSLQDLKQIFDGKMLGLMERAIDYGRKHITSCEMCFLRGFVCEVCKDAKIIFPFDISDTFNCPTCCGVFHKHCVYSESCCPKCKRQKIRLESLTSSQEQTLDC